MILFDSDKICTTKGISFLGRIISQVCLDIFVGFSLEDYLSALMKRHNSEPCVLSVMVQQAAGLTFFKANIGVDAGLDDRIDLVGC